MDKQTPAVNKLWTKNFTIITVGTIISMLGNTISSFAIGLIVLDKTNSTFLYVLFIVMYSLPKMIMNSLAGPYLDKYSRAQVIYVLDFISAALYAGIFVLMLFDIFSYVPFLLLVIVIGSIDGTYTVAYESLYPTLVTEGNYGKAYSISSLIYPMTAVMVPVAALMYNVVGSAPIFAFNAVTFLSAAIMETQIKAPVVADGKTVKEEKLTLRTYKAEFMEGVDYIKKEPGLLITTVFCFITAISSNASGAITLPYFRNTEGLGVFWYICVMGGGILGRLVAGAVHYKKSFIANKKFMTFVGIYTIICIMEGGYLYTPTWCMMIMLFVSGYLNVNAYNIRVSATQSYVPDKVRARFNGTFQTFSTVGSIVGQLAAGGLAELLSERTVIFGFMGLNLIAVFAVMYRGRKYVEPVFNREV